MSLKTIDYLEIALKLEAETQAVTKSETVVLSSLNANTWTNLPTPVTISLIFSFDVLDAVGSYVTDSFEYRLENSSWQIHSVIALTDLQIQFTGV